MAHKKMSPPPGGSGERAGDSSGNRNWPDYSKPSSPSPAAIGRTDEKILLTTLWERTSAKGTVYLSGFLGKARLVAFRGDPLEDGTPTWKLFISPG